MAANEGTKLRVATGKIILHRDGKRIVVNANQSFKFTASELESLKEANPDAVRTPVNEEESAVEVKAPVAKGSASSKSTDKTDKGEGKGDNKSEDL